MYGIQTDGTPRNTRSKCDDEMLNRPVSYGRSDTFLRSQVVKEIVDDFISSLKRRGRKKSKKKQIIEFDVKEGARTRTKGKYSPIEKWANR